MIARRRIVTGLSAMRYVAAIAMLGVVIAGALGYGDAVKLWVAAGGVTLAVALKVTHFV